MGRTIEYVFNDNNKKGKTQFLRNKFRFSKNRDRGLYFWLACV